jgi:nucleoside-diphosphate-sugar epimerase
MSILDSDNDLLYGDVLQMTPYAYSKYLAETYCLKSRLSHVSCVRFATLFYKDPKKDGLSKLVADAVTNGRITIFNHGDARRNFLPLHVASQYINKLTQLKDAPKRTYTFAAQDPTSFKEVALFLKRCLPRLKIEDKTIAQGPQVLASFSTEDIKAIGPIKFSLEDEITDYIETLKK